MDRPHARLALVALLLAAALAGASAWLLRDGVRGAPPRGEPRAGSTGEPQSEAALAAPPRASAAGERLAADALEGEATDGPAAAPRRWLAGRVVDEGGAPIADAKVRATHDDVHRRARTDGAGRFTLEGPAASPGALLELLIVASDGEWDEGRVLETEAPLGKQDGQWTVPIRTRVRFRVAGDDVLGGFGVGFDFDRVEAEAVRIQPGVGEWSDGNGWTGGRGDSSRAATARTGSVQVSDGVGVAYDLEPGVYELRFLVLVGDTLRTEPLVRFEIARGEQVELGPVFPGRGLEPRRVVLAGQDGQPLPAGVRVLVAADRASERSDPRVRETTTDPGGAVTLPVPHGGAEPPALTFRVPNAEGPDLLGRLPSVRGGETVTLRPGDVADGPP